jgi:Spy/CpxP family protein refolding chaperone
MRPTARLAAIAGLALCSLALAQPEPDVLRGPKVKETGVPGEQRQFTPGRVRGRDMMGAELPHRIFMRALDALRSDQAGELRLTRAQEAKIKAINDDFNAALLEYRAANLEKVRELLPLLSPEDRRRVQQFLDQRGSRQRLPEPAKDVDPDQAEQAREKIREILSGLPSPADTHARIYAVLTEPQQKVFNNELTRLRERRPEVDRLPRLDDLPEPVRERIKKLPPEEQREAIRRYLEQTKDNPGTRADQPRTPERPRERSDRPEPKPEPN